MNPIPDHERIAMSIETDTERVRVPLRVVEPEPTEEELWRDVEALHPNLRPELEGILAKAKTEFEQETSR